MRWRSRSKGASDGRSILKAPGSRSGNLRRATDSRGRRSVARSADLEEPLDLVAAQESSSGHERAGRADRRDQAEHVVPLLDGEVADRATDIDVPLKRGDVLQAPSDRE